MAGIRVSWIPSTCTEKDIKIHFTKPENGGGLIQAIYYPLFNNEAVVIFKDQITVQTVRVKAHSLLGEDISVRPLHILQVFTEMEAKLDPSVAAFIQTTDEVRDEIQYHGNVELCLDQNNSIVGVRGNWYQLEWTWALIERVTIHQSRKYQDRTTPGLRRSAQQRPPSPMEVNDPMINMPTEPDSRQRLREKPVDSAKAEYKRSTSDTKIQTDFKSDKMNMNSSLQREGVRRDSLDSDDDEDNDEFDEKLARLSLSGKEETLAEINILNDKPEDVRSLDFRYGPLTVSVYSGMITMAETEAIVNAAMGSMIHAGGVARAIANAAGPEMQRQCDEFVEKHGNVPTTKVMHTCAGGQISLNVKYVIHAVGPIYSSTQERTCASQLTQTFLNCMAYGNDVLKIRSITMPVISSGIFGCPLELCVRSFFNAVLLFSYEHMSGVVHLKEVNLVNNNSDNTALTVMQLRELISHEIADLVQEAQQQLQHVEEIQYRSGQLLKEDYITEYEYRNRNTRYGGTDTLTGSKTSPLASGVSGSSFLSPLKYDTGKKYREITTSLSPRYDLDSRSPRTEIDTSASSFERRTALNPSFAKTSLSTTSSALGTSVDRDYNVGLVSNRNTKIDTGSLTSKKSGPPTTSYLYSDSRASGTNVGATSGGKTRTVGRPLPPVPTVVPRQPRKY